MVLNEERVHDDRKHMVDKEQNSFKTICGKTGELLIHRTCRKRIYVISVETPAAVLEERPLFPK